MSSSSNMNHQAIPEDFQEIVARLIGAIRQENIDDIRAISSFHPDCLHGATLFQDTLLHLALKNNKIVAFGVLVEELKRHGHEHRVLGARDRGGNTVLHIAVSNRLVEVVKMLLADTGTKMAVNSKNKMGQTALDIYYGHGFEFDTVGEEIEDILLEAGAQRGRSLTNYVCGHV